MNMINSYIPDPSKINDDDELISLIYELSERIPYRLNLTLDQLTLPRVDKKNPPPRPQNSFILYMRNWWNGPSKCKNPKDAKIIWKDPNIKQLFEVIYQLCLIRHKQLFPNYVPPGKKTSSKSLPKRKTSSKKKISSKLLRKKKISSKSHKRKTSSTSLPKRKTSPISSPQPQVESRPMNYEFYELHVTNSNPSQEDMELMAIQKFPEYTPPQPQVESSLMNHEFHKFHITNLNPSQEDMELMAIQRFEEMLISEYTPPQVELSPMNYEFNNFQDIDLNPSQEDMKLMAIQIFEAFMPEYTPPQPQVESSPMNHEFYEFNVTNFNSSQEDMEFMERQRFEETFMPEYTSGYTPPQAQVESSPMNHEFHEFHVTNLDSSQEDMGLMAIQRFEETFMPEYTRLEEFDFLKTMNFQ
ncbi:hypothetical protein C1645_876377 [Glomus cerebriforme]|uniref:Uncharacterized protein n=1 Tax=Glomus cerebriforme TaxID=658196 RepID=A0A397SVH5_9GLOM|nr:hypothetical protein C1645_876377 [Glomus cerebriforme]